jgi:glycosyltransferase involved in cell wall biosynthesis
MRVAVLGQYPLDEERILGGVEAVMVPLVRSLGSLNGLDLHVITCLPGASDQLRTTRGGSPLHVLRRRRLGRATLHVRDVSAIAQTVTSLAPDVVHAQGLGIYAGAAARCACPHVVTTHGIVFREAEFASGPAARWRGCMDSLYERRILARVRNFISISPYVEQELDRIGGVRGRLFRVENPVDDAFFSRRGESEPTTILYAGRVIARKGLFELLQALIEVQTSVPGVRLRVAGEFKSSGAYFEACREFIAQHALGDAVSFLGPQTVSRMTEEYARCAVVALPSKQETAPVAVAEAMATGRPVVATRVCGVSYMVEDGSSGILVEHGDVAALASALSRLLREGELRARMGLRGREIAEARFRAAHIARQTHEVYRTVIDNRIRHDG